MTQGQKPTGSGLVEQVPSVLRAGNTQWEQNLGAIASTDPSFIRNMAQGLHTFNTALWNAHAAFDLRQQNGEISYQASGGLGGLSYQNGRELVVRMLDLPGPNSYAEFMAVRVPVTSEADLKQQQEAGLISKNAEYAGPGHYFAGAMITEKTQSGQTTRRVDPYAYLQPLKELEQAKTPQEKAKAQARLDGTLDNGFDPRLFGVPLELKSQVGSQVGSTWPQKATSRELAAQRAANSPGNKMYSPNGGGPVGLAAGLKLYNLKSYFKGDPTLPLDSLPPYQHPAPVQGTPAPAAGSAPAASAPAGGTTATPTGSFPQPQQQPQQRAGGAPPVQIYRQQDCVTVPVLGRVCTDVLNQAVRGTVNMGADAVRGVVDGASSPSAAPAPAQRPAPAPDPGGGG